MALKNSNEVESRLAMAVLAIHHAMDEIDGVENTPEEKEVYFKLIDASNWCYERLSEETRDRLARKLNQLYGDEKGL